MYEVGPRAFERLGADVVTIGNQPDGTNINVGCGATDLRLLNETVAAGEFDLGVAFDGDGDRMLAVDAEGAELDGDQILAVLALHLGVDQVAVTEMTNLGFHRLMAERGVRVLTTPSATATCSRPFGARAGVLGGEQSGHVIWLDGHTTGDGLVAAILALPGGSRERERSSATWRRRWSKLPQAKANVPVRSKAISEGRSGERSKTRSGDGSRRRPPVRNGARRAGARRGRNARKRPKVSVVGSRTLVSRELG